MRYKAKRAYQWSNGIAYSVGLMASDGCLSSDGRHLDLTSIDIEQLHNFSNSIGRKLPISTKSSGSGRQAYRIEFSDVAYYDFLLSAGLTPAKSQTISELNIPDEYYGHFLRGLFDGDGTTYAYFDPRWPKSYLYYVGFTSASISFLSYLLEKNSQLINALGSSIRKGGRASTLVYGKKDSYLIYRFMYRNDEGLSLLRKKKKLESFLKINDDAIITINARVVER